MSIALFIPINCRNERKLCARILFFFVSVRKPKTPKSWFCANWNHRVARETPRIHRCILWLRGTAKGGEKRIKFIFVCIKIFIWNAIAIDVSNLMKLKQWHCVTASSFRSIFHWYSIQISLSAQFSFESHTANTDAQSEEVLHKLWVCKTKVHNAISVRVEQSTYIYSKLANMYCRSYTATHTLVRAHTHTHTNTRRTQKTFGNFISGFVAQHSPCVVHAQQSLRAC